MKSKILKIANYLLYLSICATISVGIILEYRLPHGPKNRDLALFGLSRHDWGEIHFVCAAIFVAFSIIHLALNWSWVTKVGAHGSRALKFASVGLGAALIILPLLFPLD